MIGQMNQTNQENQENEAKEMLKKILELTEENNKMTKSIKSFIGFQKFMSFVYFLIIVVPIVLSIIYLPPLLKGVFGQYKELLGGSGINLNLDSLLKSGTTGTNLQNLDLNKLKLDNLPADLKNNLPKK
jgi:hypothetical protein